VQSQDICAMPKLGIAGVLPLIMLILLAACAPASEPLPPSAPTPLPIPAPAPPPSPAQPPPQLELEPHYQEVLYTMRGSSEYYSWVTYGKYLHSGENVRAVAQLLGKSSDYDEWVCSVINPEGAVCLGDFTAGLGERIGLDFHAEKDGYHHIFVQHYSALDRNLSLRIPTGWEKTGYGYSEDELGRWLKQHFPVTYE